MVMTGTFADIGNILVVAGISWVIFRVLDLQNESYIKFYKRISLLFFSGALTLFVLYFSFLKRYFEIFSFTPFILLVLFFIILVLVYHSMRRSITLDFLRNLEERKIYFASMSYRYLIYKSFDIFYQQVAIICVLTFMRDLGISFITLIVLFSISFSLSHLHMLKRGMFVGTIFLGAALFGGIIFPILLTVQYGIVYSYMVHWTFYIVLGVITHYSHKHHKNRNHAKQTVVT
jgi:hypothetical protein